MKAASCAAHRVGISDHGQCGVEDCGELMVKFYDFDADGHVWEGIIDRRSLSRPAFGPSIFGDHLTPALAGV